MTMRLFFLLAAIVLLGFAQEVRCEESPYTEYVSRDIKALSAEQIEGYLAGHGMGLALAAELNGYPGPKHVLEISSELSLSPSQLSSITEVFSSMQTAAVSLGEKIVAAESALDAAFSDESISKEKLDTLSQQIGALQGQLRAVHLAAHLETKALLTPEQTHQYAVLRGYQGAKNCPLKHDHE